MLEDLIVNAQSGFASGTRADDGVIQVQMNNVTTDGYLDLSNFIRVPASTKQLKNYQLQVNDLLFNATNSPNLVGKTTLFRGFKEPVTFSNHFIRLRVDESQVEPSYLAKWFIVQWQARIFEKLCTQWVNQATVRKEDLLNLKICLPPIDEQKRIAAIAQKADRLRRTRRYALQLSDTYLQSVFLEMFGDPVTNPKGWKIVEIGDVCIKVTDGTHQPPTFTASGIPFIFVQNIAKGEIDFSNIRYVSEATYKELTRHTKVEKKI
uniref:Restriction endonuclease subunit S n=1 Tax=Desertifilum tharense IPPAS B-1220 TaxID=1781255 RepID=A0ACD5GZ52_9CYAN